MVFLQNIECRYLPGRPTTQGPKYHSEFIELMTIQHGFGHSNLAEILITRVRTLRRYRWQYKSDTIVRLLQQGTSQDGLIAYEASIPQQAQPSQGPCLCGQEIVEIVPPVHAVRGDTGMFARGSHVPNVIIASYDIVQPHFVNGPHYQQIRPQDFSSTQCALCARSIPCTYVERVQGLASTVAIRDTMSWHTLSHLQSKLKLSHSTEMTVQDFTINLGIPHTPLYPLMLFTYVCFQYKILLEVRGKKHR